MSWWQKKFESWKQDRILRLVLKNTGYMFSGTGLSLILSMAVSIIVAQQLEVFTLGLVGIITTYASTVNRLFSFRMNEIVVKYMGSALSEGNQEKAGALVKVSMLIEGGTSILAFLCLLLFSPLVAHYMAKDDGTVILFCVYGISVLGNLIAETSTGILQVINRFREQATINAVQSVITTVIILSALFFKDQPALALWIILLAYLVGKMILGIAPAVIALRSLGGILGNDWWKTSFKSLPPVRELVRFAVSTNFSATLNMIFRDSELLWISFFLSPIEAGYYKVALAIINLISIPVTPFISTTYPLITKHAAERQWKKLRSLLWRITLVSCAIVGSTTLVLALFGPFVLYFYGNGLKYVPAFPVLLVLLAGYGIANMFFWNRPLLLALDHPEFPFRIGLYTGIVKVLASFWVIPVFGVVGAAALLTGYLGISVLMMVFIGILICTRREKRHSEPEMAKP